MKFILAIAVTLAFCYFLRKSIKKHAKYYYIGALVISLFTIFVSASMLPAPLATFMSTFFQYGTVATAMFSLVMYTNAFHNGSFIQKTFMPIRAELSIIACILAYGHNIYTGKSYFVMLFTHADKMSTSTICATLLTLVLLLIMTPLFVTSFKSVRKKMKPKSWKKLQQWAYVFYMLIYVHIMCLILPLAFTGNSTYILDVVVYSVVFLGYATLRLLKYYKKSNKKIAIGLIVAMYVALGAVLLVNIVDMTTEPAVSETTESTESIESDEVETESDAVPEEPTSPYAIDLTAIADGTYTGSADGFNGAVTVTVTMTDGAIEKITLDEHIDDEEYMNSATSIRKKIVEAQDIDVDVITGATYSSNGIKNAVLDALT